jgi:hypothetical protein
MNSSMIMSEQNNHVKNIGIEVYIYSTVSTKFVVQAIVNEKKCVLWFGVSLHNSIVSLRSSRMSLYSSGVSTK